MSNYIVDGSDLTSVADAIRAKSGGSSALAFPAGFVSEIGAIPSGGYTIDEICNGTFGVVNYDGIRIKSYTFYGTSITEIHAPHCERFSDAANPTADSGGERVFYGCKSLTVVDFPALSHIGSGGYQFAQCTALESVFLPLTCPGKYGFQSCTKLKTAVFGVKLDTASQMNSNGFYGCTALTAVDCQTSKVDSQDFFLCSKLTTLVIRTTGSVPALANISAFNNSPFASGKDGGTLYVPQALISSYQSATNWSTILGYANNQILPIEGSIYETEYADGTPIT